MTKQTDTQRLLAVLSDGRPHSHKSLYRLGIMVHSRAADLRRKGHEVVCWRDGTRYFYQLKRAA